MKQFCFAALFCIISTLVLPLIVFSIMNINVNKINSSQIDKTHEDISIYFCDDNTIKTMNMEEYLCGVVSAEMPASFEKEALRAQAVAARSYAVYKKKNPANEHPGAAVCTDYTHCKAYKSDENLKKQWGNDYKTNQKKIKDAVYSTKGEIVTYNGEAALTVFHSQSGSGRTENSKDVWGGDVPYLISVESYGEEIAPNFYSSVTVNFNEFKETLQKFNDSLIINSFKDIGIPERSEGGSVKNITIGNVNFSGKDIRSCFNLRSSCFDIFADDTNVRFEVTGYGHGVGMSQYGANAMAKDGLSYKQILTHYYTGTNVENV